jgi:hypothetical protein
MDGLSGRIGDEMEMEAHRRLSRRTFAGDAGHPQPVLDEPPGTREKPVDITRSLPNPPVLPLPRGESAGSGRFLPTVAENRESLSTLDRHPRFPRDHRPIDSLAPGRKSGDLPTIVTIFDPAVPKRSKTPASMAIHDFHRQPLSTTTI